MLAAMAVGVAALFVFRTLTVIDLTSLWNDELRTVEKSFQPSLAFLWRYLRSDVHPPLYYLAVWLLGQLFGQTVLVLRGFSWVLYLLTGLALMAAVWRWRPSGVALASAGLLAWALPFTVRFAVEGKAYALMAALIALALWQRQRLLLKRPGAARWYGLAWAAAALTHYYAFGLLLAQVACDARRGWRAPMRAACWALILPGLWTISLISFLSTQAGREWIPPASPVLLTQTLRLALGDQWLWILAITAALVGVLTLTRRPAPAEPRGGLVAAWGLDAALLLTLVSVTVSLWKPSAVDRYYIVVVPACIGALSCWFGTQIRVQERLDWRAALTLLALTLLLVRFWGDAYTPVLPRQGVIHRKGENVRAISLATADAPWRYSRQCRQLNASDHVLRQGHWPVGDHAWICVGPRLQHQDWVRLIAPLKPGDALVMAAVGKRQISLGGIERDREQLEGMGLRCGRMQRYGPGTRLLRCSLPSA